MSRRNANVNSYQALALARRATPQPTAAGSVLGHEDTKDESESSKAEGSIIRKQRDKEVGRKKKGGGKKKGMKKAEVARSQEA